MGGAGTTLGGCGTGGAGTNATKKKKRQIFELGDDQSNPGSDRKTYPIKQEKMFTL